MIRASGIFIKVYDKYTNKYLLYEYMVVDGNISKETKIDDLKKGLYKEFDKYIDRDCLDLSVYNINLIDVSIRICFEINDANSALVGLYRIDLNNFGNVICDIIRKCLDRYGLSGNITDNMVRF